jgi:cell division protein FtsL
MSAVDAPERRRRPAPRAAYVSQGSAAVAPAPEVNPRPRREDPSRADHLRVVAPSERRRRRVTPAAAVLLTATVFALLFGVAIAHTVLVEGQVRLDELDRELTVEQARYQELRQEVAALESPSRVVAAAHEQGMVTPEDLVYLQPPPAEPTSDPDATTDPEPVPTDDQVWSNIKPLLGPPNP